MPDSGLSRWSQYDRFQASETWFPLQRLCHQPSQTPTPTTAPRPWRDARQVRSTAQETSPVWCGRRGEPLLEVCLSGCGCRLALQPYPDGLSSTWACGLLGRSLIIQSNPAIPAEQKDCPFTTTTAAVRPGANAEEYHPSYEIPHSSPGRETEKSRALDSIMTHARVFPFENKHRLKQARACRMLPGPR